MFTFYKIDPALDIPIYQQLVDMIRVAVKKGDLTFGQKLPTVQELSQDLNVARGTIKRAYDELEHEGLIEKVQGRGTFVSYRPVNSASRKDQAMVAIDNLLDQLEDMGLSTPEINIFINLKIRERAEEQSYIKVAVVECNPENLSQISEQLSHITQVELHSFLLENIQNYPFKLGEDFDLIVVTATHVEYIESILPNKKRVAQVALRPSARCLSHIIKLRSGKKIGIIGASERFCHLLAKTCHTYTEDLLLSEPLVFTPGIGVLDYLKTHDTILVPKSYEKYFDTETTKTLHDFEDKLIECYYEMDEGSALYLEAKIKKLIDDKKL